MVDRIQTALQSARDIASKHAVELAKVIEDADVQNPQELSTVVIAYMGALQRGLNSEADKMLISAKNV